MRRFVSMTCLVCLFAFLGACSSDSDGGAQYSKLLTRKKNLSAPTTTIRIDNLENCEDFVVLISASKLGKKIGKPKEWVQENFYISLYADTSKAGSRVLSAMRPGAHCFLINQEGYWFHVQSPVDNIVGWVKREYVVGFIKKDPVTLVPCSG